MAVDLWGIDLDEDERRRLEEEERRTAPTGPPLPPPPPSPSPNPPPISGEVFFDASRTGATRDTAQQDWERVFREIAGQAPTAEDLYDFEQKWRHTPEFGTSQGGSYNAERPWERPGYDSPATGLRSWTDLLNETMRDLDVRFNRPTASAGGVGGDLDPFQRAPSSWRSQFDEAFGAPPSVPRGGAGAGGRGDFRGLGAYAQPGTTEGLPPFQFTDPYTRLYEDVANRYLQSLTGPNAQIEQLMNFINQQFTARSTTPGWTEAERAMMNTQALEPIEALRQAAHARALERTSQAGYLPSSGVALSRQDDIDRYHNQLRTVANRELALAGTAQQRADLDAALQLAQLGVQIPNLQSQQALNVANTLYQLPRTAMLDAAGIVNASAPSGAISPWISLLQTSLQNDQDRRRLGLITDERTAAFWRDIVNAIPGFVDIFG